MQSLKFIHVYLISDCYRFVPVTMRGDIKHRFSCETALQWDFKEDKTETVNRLVVRHASSCFSRNWISKVAILNWTATEKKISDNIKETFYLVSE